MLLDFYSSDCYLSKLGKESHRFSFVTFCTVNGPEFGRLFSACQQARSSLCSQGLLPCGGQTGRRAFQKINRHLVQICALLSLSSFLSCGRRQLPGPPCPPGTGPIICPLRRVGSLVAPGVGASRLDWLPGSHSPGPSGPDLWHRGPPQEVTGGFHCLGLGYPGAGDADDVFVGRGSEERLGLAILSVPSSWSSGTRGGHVQVPVAGSNAPLCLLTQSAGEREASRWLPPPPPAPAMEPHVNKAQGSNNLQSWSHSCSWLASLPIPGLAPTWVPPSPPAQLPAGTVYQYSGWSVRELRPSNRIWACLLQSSETEGGTTAEHPCSSGGDESGKASWRRQRWCPGGG